VGPALTMDDVYADVIDDIMNRTLTEFEPMGPAPAFQARFTKIEKTGYGNIFEFYHSSVDPNDPNAQTMVVESRSTVEIYVPATIDFNDLSTAWMMVWSTPVHIPGEPEPDDVRRRRIFARKAAERGMTVCLWSEHDRYPVVPGQPTEDVPHQLGSTEGRLVQDGFDLMMRKDPSVTPLVLEDFKRLWRHYGISLGFMYATTLAQRVMSDTYGPQADNWIDSMKVVLGGGSKGVGGVVAAAGIDPRVGAVRYSGSRELQTDETASQHRYETDWGECPGGAHRRADFAKWAYENRDNSPSYYDIFIAGHDPDRYQDKLWLDVIGTHDWSTPLGSHTKWWEERDGLIGGVVDPGEFQWNWRTINRWNVNHGVSYTVGTKGNFDVYATDLLLWRLLRHLILGESLARVDMVSLDVTGTTSWSTRVRVTESSALSEDLVVWVMLSDDRDTRRCDSPPIATVQGGNCIDSSIDDNKPEEDFFIPIIPDSVVVDGEFRDIVFTPPAQLAAFGPDPQVVASVELFARGPNANSIVDDTVVHTRIIIKNAELYPEQSCP
jgi:hypothetical protein